MASTWNTQKFECGAHRNWEWRYTTLIALRMPWSRLDVLYHLWMLKFTNKANISWSAISSFSRVSVMMHCTSSLIRGIIGMGPFQTSHVQDGDVRLRCWLKRSSYRMLYSMSNSESVQLTTPEWKKSICNYYGCLHTWTTTVFKRAYLRSGWFALPPDKNCGVGAGSPANS